MQNKTKLCQNFQNCLMVSTKNICLIYILVCKDFKGALLYLRKPFKKFLGKFHSGKFTPGQFSPRTIALPPDNYTQLLPRAMTITKYNFFMAVFCFFSMAQLYNFCYDNKNNNDNKTWSLKLMSVIIL